MTANRRLSDCVLAVHNALPAQLTSSILASYGSSTRWRPATVGPGVLDRSSRHCDVIDLSRPSEGSGAGESDPWAEGVLRAAVQQVYVKYRGAFPKAVVGRDYGYKLLRYGTGGFYEEHVDEAGETGRILSCSVILNDDFAGGEMAWFGGELVIPPERGMVILFPSNFLFPHAVLPVHEGTRYSVVTWLG
jgi:hypothetical protein